MTYQFCTLFDKNFLARGMALYQSLVEQCSDFTLWMLCMDEKSYDVLKKLNLDNIKPLRLSEVEDEKLREVRPTRTPVEYCWMFSSSLPLYLLQKNPQIETIAYLDADMYFYAPLDEIYREFGNKSIMIIPHAYSEKNKHREKTSGIYNVGMMLFRNDSNALECLSWWKDRVIEWCFSYYEDGKLGDQLYLNDWPTRFKGVHILQNMGADVAPWNNARFAFRVENKKIIGKEKTSSKKFDLIFFHFHGLKIYSARNGKIRPYPITVYEKTIYRTYVKALQKSYDMLRTLEPEWEYGCAKKLDLFRVIKQYIIQITTRWQYQK